MQRVKLNPKFEVSRIAHGHWRALEWNLSVNELLNLTEQVFDLGVTTFDHADLYGDFECEKLFGKVLNLKKGLRSQIEIVTKCGIKPQSHKFPNRQIGFYDYSFEHITSSAEKALRNFKTDYIDLFLLHRPSPFFDPQEVANTFSHLKKSGKVLHFGVSNFTPQQFEMLNSYLEEPLVTNQVEISPHCLEHFDNGNLDFFLKKRLKPMAWSPLAGGAIMNPSTEKEQRIHQALQKVAQEHNTEALDQIAYSWLLKHPTGMIPIVGSGKIERIKRASESINKALSLEQWMEIYVAARGEKLP
jgi:predicted oxidoreductase